MKRVMKPCHKNVQICEVTNVSVKNPAEMTRELEKAWSLCRDKRSDYTNEDLSRPG